jgi:uncharacterized protein (TIGR00661 family)
MKILYSVQATGNGHISRAMELLPYLNEYGKVDIFLSGDNSNLPLEAPVKYKSRGLSLYYNCTGGLDYWQILKGFQPLRLKQEIRDLPVENYDLVINDFEYITAAACAKKRVPSVNFGHQASFQSVHCPRPEKKNIAGEYILKNYAKASRYIGLHFKRYDDFILTPVIKEEILTAEPSDKNYITVYLPSLCEPQLNTLFKNLKTHQFQIFCREAKQIRKEGHITFLPVDKHLFNNSLVHCTGIITGAGFETPAEALHLGKKLMVIPISGQYEQLCNAAALKEMGVVCLKKIDADFSIHFTTWMNNKNVVQVSYANSIGESLFRLFAGNTSTSVPDSAATTTSGLLSCLF